MNLRKNNRSIEPITVVQEHMSDQIYNSNNSNDERGVKQVQGKVYIKSGLRNAITKRRRKNNIKEQNEKTTGAANLINTEHFSPDIDVM